MSSETKIITGIKAIECWIKPHPEGNIRHCTLYTKIGKKPKRAGSFPGISFTIAESVWQQEDYPFEVTGQPPYTCTIDKTKITLHNPPSELAKLFPKGVVKDVADWTEITSLICEGKKSKKVNYETIKYPTGTRIVFPNFAVFHPR